MAPEMEGEIRFLDFRLDLAQAELWRGGVAVELLPKPASLLVYLVRNRGRTVPKTELLDTLWPGVHVSDSALTSAVKQLRHALGEAGHTAVETRRGRGYRFVAEVTEAAAAPPERPDLFVGRSALLEELTEAWQRARDGRGGLLLLSGEPGIGKTRSAEELANLALADADVFLARAYEAESTPPFWLWVQLLRGFARARGAGAFARIAGERAPRLMRLVPGLAAGDAAQAASPEPPDLDRGSERFALYDELVDFLVRAARDRPLLLILDDLHWADPSSLRVLQAASTELAASRALVVATYRDEELRAGHPLVDLLALAARRSDCRQLRLGALEREDAARYVEHALDRTGIDGLIDDLFRQSAGNPLFLRQLVQWIADEGWERLDPKAALPPELRAVVLGRIDRLGGPSRALLEAAAVVADEFSIASLASVGELERAETADLAGDALARGLFREVAPGRLRFGHQLIRDALLGEIPESRRAALHLRAATALRERTSDHDDVAAELSFHFFEVARTGGESEAALEWARRAAAVAEQRLAFDEAASHYGHAIDALGIAGRGSSLEECELLLARAEALDRIGDLGAARPLLVSVCDIARRCDATEPFVRATIALGRAIPFELGAADEQQTNLVAEALERLGEGDAAARAELLARLSLLVYWTEERERSAELVATALHCSQETEDRRARAQAALARWVVTRGPEVAEDPRPVAAEFVRAAERVPEAQLQSFALAADYLSHIRMGDVTAAEAALDRHHRLGETSRQAMIRSYGASARGMLALFRGDLERAEALANEGLRLGERYSATNVRLAHQALVLQVRVEQGRCEELAGILPPDARSLGDLGLAALPLAWLCCELGRLDEARDLLRRVCDDELRAFTRDQLWPTHCAFAAMVCSEVDAPDIASRLHAEMAGHRGQIVTSFLGPAGPFDGYLGRLARVAGKIEAAERHLEDAIELCDAMGSALHGGWSRCELARTLLATGSPPARTRARELLDDALRRSSALPLAALRSHAQSLLAGADGDA